MRTFDVWATGQQDTVVGVLRRAAERWGDRQFLDLSGETYSYLDIHRQSSRLANTLAAHGVNTGDTVVTMLDNNIHAVLSWFAINKLGAISVPVNTAYKGDFLRHQIADAAATVIVAESDYVERIGLIENDLPAIKLVLHTNTVAPSALSRIEMLSLESTLSADDRDPGYEPKPSDLSMLIYTGGTTGPSKGCMISHNYACNLARQANDCTERDETSVMWTALPLFHLNATAASLLATMMSGGRVVLAPRFSVSNFWPDIERSGATHVSLLGSMFPMLAQAPDNEAMQRCRGQLVTVMGAPFPSVLQTIWKERFGVRYTFAPGYGLSEASLVTTIRCSEEAKPGSSGRRNEWFDVRIVDDNDQELPPGVAGEVIIRPRQPHVMFEGYWNRPADTLKIMKNLWLHSGDIGKFDEDGFFYFVDRKKDYLRRRGENISSFEMETTFRAHPAVEDVAVHAVPSDVTEDDVKVTAILKAGSTITEDELCRWSIERLPYFAVPRFIEFRSQLPRNPVGRVLKYQLRDEGVTPQTWDREKSDIKLQKR
ncbi:AMP-binding protein [Sinimarinibacterium flocculans]|uniref:Crotonobetaine/carnitine-CoA ligase n=1 Tax=Sinimarinibacterium flocculans TaxID=985250 RepID=A0A318EKW5_9GAMM|nr:AMP-binding protein [Sinimarinibacterium flocculans]PXV71665.1 crotonobetaine/carnitine-CoA ligase [Sinimarinibacterium flocculans]